MNKEDLFCNQHLIIFMQIEAIIVFENNFLSWLKFPSEICLYDPLAHYKRKLNAFQPCWIFRDKLADPDLVWFCYVQYDDILLVFQYINSDMQISYKILII